MKKLGIYATAATLIIWLAVSGVGKFIDSVKSDIDARDSKMMAQSQ